MTVLRCLMMVYVVITLTDLQNFKHTISKQVRQSAALLKNANATLPLSRSTVGKVAVIGPNALLSQSDAGYYGPNNVCQGKFWTLVDAMSSGGKINATYDLGVPNVLSEDQSGIADAVKMASEADTVVLAVGTDLTWGREGHDATNISFTDAQTALIEKVSEAAKKPVVLVLFTATPLDISAQLSNAKIGAILHVGQPSVTILGVEELMYEMLLLVVRLVFEREAREIQSCLSLQHALRCQNEDQHSNTNNRTPTLEHQHSNTNARTPTLKHQHSNTGTIQTFYPASYQDGCRSSISERPGTSPFARPDCTNSDDPVNVLEVRIRVERIDSTRVNPSYRSDTASYTSFSYAVQTLYTDFTRALDYLIRDASFEVIISCPRNSSPNTLNVWDGKTLCSML